MENEGAGKKILAVDDKKDNLRLVAKVLGVRGYQVSTAQTGEDAVRVTQAERPNLVLMDIRMPGGIDGLEATRRIREMPGLAHIPIVAMTASVRTVDMQVALDAGCAGFIRKPIDINEFPKQVAEYIAQAERQSSRPD